MIKQIILKWIKKPLFWLVVALMVCVVVIDVQCSVNRRLMAQNKAGVAMITDTVYREVTVVKPSPIIARVERLEQVRLPVVPVTLFVNDTIRDSVLVEVPIEVKVYDDAQYHAVVSGFRPSLDTLRLRSPIITTTRTVYRRAWLSAGIGVGASYDPFNNKVYPAITAGVFVPIFRIR